MISFSATIIETAILFPMIENPTQIILSRSDIEQRIAERYSIKLPISSFFLGMYTLKSHQEPYGNGLVDLYPHSLREDILIESGRMEPRETRYIWSAALWRSKIIWITANLFPWSIELISEHINGIKRNKIYPEGEKREMIDRWDKIYTDAQKVWEWATGVPYIGKDTVPPWFITEWYYAKQAELRKSIQIPTEGEQNDGFFPDKDIELDSDFGLPF